ncbi:MAG: TRAP transporter small permease subunit [Gammaproteobacteria bacterium]|nr:TRAP transporter small permease subunit [Gammaproteobacteria bacterium]
MIRLIAAIDTLSTWVGKAFAWCILVLTLAYTYEVFVRYVLNDPTAWAFDISYTMYGALFMMAGAYTLSRDAHVRGDVIFRLWRPRVQAWIELILIFLFLFPGMAALVYAGYDYAAESWSYRPYGFDGPAGEISINSPAGVPVSPLKTILPIAALFVFIQGIAEVCRCIICIREGSWPERQKDVEETEDALLRMMHEREEKLEHQLHIDERHEEQEQDQERKDETGGESR